MDREAPDLSGVYMQRLSSKSVKILDAANGFCQGGSHVNIGQGSSEVFNPQLSTDSTLRPQVQQQRKKVRRRLHTSKPFQDGILNMAEARREIVNALKFHRASMKQQKQKQQEEPFQMVHRTPQQILSGPSEDDPLFPSPLNKYHQPRTPLTHDSSNLMFNANATAPDSCYEDNSSFSFSLPSQTLGLNLNFQELSNISTSHFQNNPSLFNSCSSSTSCPALSSNTIEEIHSATEDSIGGVGGIMSPYPVMDSELMKEIKSMGDCYDMVWNDTMNSLTSAWWLKFAEATEMSPEEFEQSKDERMLFQLDELPSWLNPTESYLQAVINITCPEDYSPYPSLPW